MVSTEQCPTIPEPDEGLSSWRFSRFYAFMLSSLGFYYGVGLYLFVTAFHPFIETLGYKSGEHRAVIIHEKLNGYFAVGCIVATLITSVLYEKFGRYKMMIAALISGTIINISMAHISLRHYYPLRFLSGLIGYFWVFLASVIMTEYLPEKLENGFNPFFTAMLSAGATFASAFYFPTFIDNWSYLMVGLGLYELLKLIFFVSYRMESPIWMARHNYSVDDIKNNCALLYTPQMAKNIAIAVRAKVDKEHAEEKTERLLINEYGKAVYYYRMFKRFITVNYRRLFLVILANVYSQLCGSIILECYSDHIFEQEGIAMHSYLSLIQSVNGIVAGILIFFITPIFGKRAVLIAGFLGMMIGYTLYIWGAVFGHKVFIGIGLPFAFFAYAISLGGVRFSYNSAILGGSSLSICSFFEQIISAVLASTSKGLLEKYTPLRVFFVVQMLSTACAIPFIIFSRDVKERTVHSA